MRKCSRRVWGHRWVHSPFWASDYRSIYTGDIIARSGKRCYHCGEMIWDESDEEFRNGLIDSGVIDSKPSQGSQEGF